MKEDTYLEDSVKKCVDYMFSKDIEAQKRIATGLFETIDNLTNEQLIVKVLNEEEKREWFNNEILESDYKEIERLNNIIDEYVKPLIALQNRINNGMSVEEQNKYAIRYVKLKLQELKGSGK